MASLHSSRRFVLLAFGVLVLAAIGTLLVLTVVKQRSLGPKAVVDGNPWDLGVIESGDEFQHTFVIRNEGRSPLMLKPGPKLCACTLTHLPTEPVPPGGEANVEVSFTESVKQELMKPGRSSKGVRVLTNDPENADILLEVRFTVSRRVAVSPSDLNLTIDSSKKTTPAERSGVVVVHSQRWDKFTLSATGMSNPLLQWHAESVSQEDLDEWEAIGAQRVKITMPPDLPEGVLAEWIDFIVTPSDGEPPQKARLDIHGRVAGRVEFYGPKVALGHLLRLGSVQQGQAAKANAVMKINEEPRQVKITRIESNPAFLKATVSPCTTGSNRGGVYRVEVEVPANAPLGSFLDPHSGVVRLYTNHPHLPRIELNVDFAVSATLTWN